VVMCTLSVGKSKWNFVVKLTRKPPSTSVVNVGNTAAVNPTP